MFQDVLSTFSHVVGVASDDLPVWQIGVRAFLIYLTLILLVKFGERRFMGKNSAFDMMLGIMLGSVLSRAITGKDSFFNVIGAGIILVSIHYVFAFISYHYDWLGSLIKGTPRILVQDGEIQRDNMRKSHISNNDLEMALYSNGKVTEPGQVKVARFERSGDISVIPREKQMKISVVEITVHEGVQKVRLELSENT